MPIIVPSTNTRPSKSCRRFLRRPARSRGTESRPSRLRQPYPHRAPPPLYNASLVRQRPPLDDGQPRWSKSGTGLTYTDNTGATSGFVQKTFWWRDGYQPVDEPRPDITGGPARRLDQTWPGLRRRAAPGTNGMRADIGSFMLVGIEIPTPRLLGDHRALRWRGL